MFFRLMNREIRNQFKSITFYMFLIVIIIYYITQYVPPTTYDPLKPIPSNLKSNGTKGIIVDELSEMTLVYYRMNYNLENDVVAKYNLGFKRWHKLNTDQKIYLKQIRNKIYGHNLNSDGTPEILVSYDEFQKILEEVNKMLGGNTVYSSKYRDNIFWGVFYGYKTIDNPNLRIRAGYREMSITITMNEYLRNSPVINWYKKLSDTQRTSIETAMKKISSKGIDENGNLINPVSYKEYESILDQLDQELGDKTVFSKQYRDELYLQNKTYADATKKFNAILDKDKITNAYGRIFSDYMGIAAGLYPVFIVIAVFLRDKKKKITELIGNKKIPPITYILSRYSAICICLLLGYLLLATHSTYVFYKIGMNYNYPVDLWAFYKYTLTWIAPTILFTVAISMLLLTVFNKISLTIIFQFVLWLFSIQTLGGDYRFHRFILRFNSLGNYNNYLLWRSSILTNRIFYTILSLGIIIITAYIYRSRMTKVYSNTL